MSIMKQIIITLSAATLLLLFGFGVNNHYTRKIACLEMQLQQQKAGTENAETSCRFEVVEDKDLISYFKSNEQNPDLNAVLVRVGTVRQALRNYTADDEVYVTITDTDSIGRNLTVVSQFSASIQGVCHFLRGGGRCCPPPRTCDNGISNRIQFFASNPQLRGSQELPELPKEAEE